MSQGQTRDGGRLETWPVGRLKPYPRNPQTHSPEQVAGIARSIEAYGFRDPIGVLPDGTIVEGHGRLEAQLQRGAVDVPVLVLDGMTEDEARGYRIAHNEHQRHAGVDEAALSEELAALVAGGFSLDGLGIDEERLRELGAAREVEPDADGRYTTKIVAPIYEPTGPCPAPSALWDQSTTAALVREIDAAPDLPSEVRAFLLAAATRHTVFHFRAVAEFYAHAQAPVQRLMERSALVVIDFDKAIEFGFVRMSERLLGLTEGPRDEG